ncbi:MAG: hypothetical protein ABIY56_00805 [Dokdonella sp.]
MTGSTLRALLRASRRRQLASVLAVALPLAIALVWLGLRTLPVAWGLTLAGVLAVLLSIAALRAWTALDDAGLARRLDAQFPTLEDSSALLWLPGERLSRLQRLQQARVAQRMQSLPLQEIQPPWPRKRLLASGLLALVLLGVATLLGDRAGETRQSRQDAAVVAAAQNSHLEKVILEINPPAYTGLPTQQQSALDARVVEGSTLQWRLRIDRDADALSLQFHDGSHLPLQRDGGDWLGTRTLQSSALYRLVLEGAPALADDPLQRIEVIADQAPEIRVLAPERALTMLDHGQPEWLLQFEAEDDYAISAAQLGITLAQGSGENITSTEQTLSLQPEGGSTRSDPRVVRYRHRLDLAALGFSQGDDLVVRLAVSDNRQPRPNTTRSASFILRWPAEVAADSAGLDGIVQKTLPAYFRSQRQIIIDSEALLGERGQLEPARFVDRADEIGVDQKILRLRYGQFLGEEFESDRLRASSLQHAATESDAHADEAATPASALAEDQHAHAQEDAPQGFGDDSKVLAEYGHVHDHAEAATLLDDATRALLKSALDQMWQAELHLRSGAPDLALPFEYAALDYIKQVQQASRIYLARVGLELPQPDLARRLGGDLAGLGERRDLAPVKAPETDVLTPLLAALQHAQTPDWAAFEAWLRGQAADRPDLLEVWAASDAVQRDPTCLACRQRLQALLWPLLPLPASGVVPRATADPAGLRYLRALQAETPQ